MMKIHQENHIDKGPYHWLSSKQIDVNIERKDEHLIRTIGNKVSPLIFHKTTYHEKFSKFLQLSQDQIITALRQLKEWTNENRMADSKQIPKIFIELLANEENMNIITTNIQHKNKFINNFNSFRKLFMVFNYFRRNRNHPAIEVIDIK